MPLGLISSEQTDDYWSQNTRRKVFYSYPNGTAPLTGFLSLADSEETTQPEYGWNEERWQQLRGTTNGAGDVVFFDTSSAALGGTVTLVAGTEYRIFLANAAEFQVDDVVTIHGLIVNSGGARTEHTFRVTAVGSGYLQVAAITSSAALTNSDASESAGLQVVWSATAYAEGSRSRQGRYSFPSEIKNYTQIHKTAWEMTGTALKAPLKYDKSGAYRSELKKKGIDHLAGMEWLMFFGNRRQETAVDPDTGQTVRRSYMGGLLWFLKQWELGSVAAGGAFDYGQANVSGQTDYITYTNKRIIRLANASVTRSTFNHIEGLPFERTNSTEFCKLCLCGPGYLGKINEAFERSVQVTQLREEQFKGWNFELVQRQMAAGKIYYKQHPLFASPEMRNSAFYIDLGQLTYRHLTDRDTDIMQMIQLPDADKRKDQYLTEFGLEINYPEAHMFVENLGGITLG